MSPKKISISEPHYEALCEQAKERGLTPEEILSEILDAYLDWEDEDETEDTPEDEETEGQEKDKGTEEDDSEDDEEEPSDDDDTEDEEDEPESKEKNPTKPQTTEGYGIPW